jgi:hypothetical protein
MRKLLDKSITLRTEGGARRQPVGRVLGRPIVFRLMTLTLAAALISIMNTSPSKADMNLKLYAYNQMSWKQFECYNWLISKESSWNPKARNGSHYGLGQMRSTWYRDLSPKQQIRAHMKYLSHRYGGDACLALRHLERKGWH